MNNLSLRMKIILGTSITSVLLTILGVVCYNSVISLELANHWVDHTHKVVERAMEIEASAVDMETGMRGFLLSGKEGFLDPYKQGEKSFYERISSLQTTVNDNPAQVTLLNEIKNNIQEWQDKVTNPAIQFRRDVLSKKHSMDEMAVLVGEARGKKYFDKFRKQISTFRNRELKLMGARQAEAKATADLTHKVIIVGVMVAFVLSLLVSFLLNHSITKPFRSIFQGLKSFSNNELNQIRQEFESVIEVLSDNGANVSSASNSIASGAAQQAASIEETSSSLEQMSAMVKNNLSNAQKSVDLSDEMKSSSESGNQSMTNLLQSMKEILESNDRIEKLVKVIGNIGEKTQIMDEIVFQTKLLSFNASVEAERAGEHGRGFAVVAQEVGNLAQMSGAAAREIAEIVKDSISNAEVITSENKSKVKQGNNYVSEAAEILDSIMKSATTVAAGSKEVLDASKDQSSGIEQISKAMSQLDQVTQENSSSTEELSAQADELNKAVNVLIKIVRGNQQTDFVDEPMPLPQSESKIYNIKEHAKRVNNNPPEKIQLASGDDSWESL